jgi:uncharacterized protein (TIGR02147 family)
MTKPSEIPSVFAFTDYRQYLQVYYTAMKKLTAHFSFRYFSKMAGLGSPNFLKLVMDGERGLSPDGIERFAKALKLKAPEAKFFRILVLMNQAETTEERDYHARQLFKSRVFRQLRPLTPDLYEYYAEWFHIPMRELVARSDFKDDPVWIAHQFTPSISEAQARSGMELLARLGLIVRDACGQWQQSDAVISTGDEAPGQAILDYQRRMIQMGEEALLRFTPEERDVSSLTLGVSAANAKKLRDMIRAFRKELLSVAAETQAVEEIMQVGFQMFPLTKTAAAIPDAKVNTSGSADQVD